MNDEFVKYTHNNMLQALPTLFMYRQNLLDFMYRQNLLDVSLKPVHIKRTQYSSSAE